jgi:hypothetical protein
MITTNSLRFFTREEREETQRQQKQRTGMKSGKIVAHPPTTETTQRA